MHGFGIRSRRIMFDSEKEMRRYQDGFKGELNTVIDILSIGLGKRDKLHERIGFSLRDGAPVGMVSQVRHDFLDTGIARLRVADHDLLSAGLLHVRSKGT